MADPIKPTQEDREAAANSPHMVGLRAAIRAGKFDDNPVVQSFALHAQQAREQGLEEAASEAERIGIRWAEETEHPSTARKVGRHAATAIRALKGPRPC